MSKTFRYGAIEQNAGVGTESRREHHWSSSNLTHVLGRCLRIKYRIAYRASVSIPENQR